MKPTPDHDPVVIEEREITFEEEQDHAASEESQNIKPRSAIWPSLGALFSGLILFLILLNLEALSHQWLERWSILGRFLQFLLLAIAALGILAILREIAALRRIKRNAHIRSSINKTKGAKETLKILNPILVSYRTGPQSQVIDWTGFERARQDGLDGQDIILAFERDILAPLDRQAQKEIEKSARRVAALTSLMPHPAVDILAVTWINLRMIRSLSEIYAGRSGFFSNLRLLRWTAAHFLAAGALELSDEAIGAIVGGSALSKLSRRFGEGAINAALTTRIGLLAQQDCRPAPFVHQTQNGLRTTLSQAVTGLFTKENSREKPS